MSQAPSFTLDAETAAAFRDWLFETGVENHAEPQIADPLADLAAAIDDELHDNTEHVAISASTTVFPPKDHSADVYNAGLTQHQSEEPTRPVDIASANDPDSDPYQLYNDLPDAAWHSPLNQTTADQDNTPTAYDQSTSSTAPLPTQAEDNRIPVQYLTSYECSVCGSRRALETSLQVCAFVDDCTACGSVDVRFTAVGIPEPIDN